MMRVAQEMLSGGPLDYYLTEMAAAHELLMTRYAPFKVGDRVRLADTALVIEVEKDMLMNDTEMENYDEEGDYEEDQEEQEELQKLRKYLH